MPPQPDLGLDYSFQPPGESDGVLVTLLVVSGGGAEQAELMATGAAIAPGVALLSPSLPPSDDLHATAEQLAAFLTAGASGLPFDPEAVWALGFGAGAVAVTALALDHPDALRGAVILSGRAPFPAPGGRILDGMKVFCAHGTSDTDVNDDDYEELVELYVTAAAEVEPHWYDCGHEIVDDEVRAAARWFARWAAATT